MTLWLTLRKYHLLKPAPIGLTSERPEPQLHLGIRAVTTVEMRIGVNCTRQTLALAKAKKPQHRQHYDNQTNNINESIHDFAYEVVSRAADLLRLGDFDLCVAQCQ
jgi:hypothetical protein